MVRRRSDQFTTLALDMTNGKQHKSRLSIWIEALRLRALPLALSCIFMGSFLAIYAGYFDLITFILTTLTTILLQLLSNLANDLGDTQHGADHDERSGPKRAVQQGLISQKNMKRAVIFLAAASFLCGLSLIFYSLSGFRQWMIFIIIGLISILAAIGYTMGSRPYGYYGLGDLSVFIFFGWVGVMGTFYLQTGFWEWKMLLPSSACSFFAVAVLNINNIRDIESDLKAGKHTFAAHLGRRKAILYHDILLFAGISCAIIYMYLLNGPLHFWAFLIIIPFLILNGLEVNKRAKKGNLDVLIKQMSFISLAFVFLFGIPLLF